MSTPLLPGQTARVETSTPVDPTLAARLVDHVERVVVGKRSVVTLSVATLLAGGHLLLEDVPGVGKTVLARTLARTIDGQHTRIQGAPDLLPTDLTGAAVWRPREERFEFVAGPLFANIVVVDEANRMPPRTQAALLEAMEEGQVSVDGVSHALPQPSMILATQNPVEQHGVHPLPESQLDRFTAATSMGYPEAADEVAIVASQLRADPLTSLPPLLDLHQLAGLQAAARNVTATADLLGYAVRLVRATRDRAGVRLGASPRAALQMVRLGQAMALIDQRPVVLPDDLKRVASAVLVHRLVVDGRGGQPDEVVQAVLHETPVTA
ncbi:AAA family ATPase [Euzebya rosea]|uniref:AAA family ATPase n=1 Tax=Euzebya rosea TaxID=2052804 RepID=UPI00196A7F92|nr:MoxR family ATPase [Euzebya rosea]